MNKNIVVVRGDLLKQPTEAIVNPWNRNLIPWWLLRPHGVSGQIKREAGFQPFRELADMGVLPISSAVYTSAGKLPFKLIIHVATISLLGRSSLSIVQASTRQAMQLAEQLNLKSIAFPLLGAGSAGLKPTAVELAMQEVFEQLSSNIRVVLVRYAGSS
jgi:O-acetyl-ADP-ribose deacetylase (regulator of RNase III)